MTEKKDTVENVDENLVESKEGLGDVAKKAKKKKPKGAGKGGAAERAVARMLTKWITGKPTPEVLWRSAMSGGKATLDGIKRHTMAGDFVAIDERGRFLTRVAVLDAKDRKSVNALDFLPLLPGEKDCHKVSEGAKTKGKKSWKDTIYCWWVKLLKEAAEAEKIPILIFKRYRSKRWYIMFDSNDWVKFYRFSLPILRVVNSVFSCVVVNMDDFVRLISPLEFEKVFPVEIVEKFERIKGYAGRDL